MVTRGNAGPARNRRRRQCFAASSLSETHGRDARRRPSAVRRRARFPTGRLRARSDVEVASSGGRLHTEIVAQTPLADCDRYRARARARLLRRRGASAVGARSRCRDRPRSAGGRRCVATPCRNPAATARAACDRRYESVTKLRALHLQPLADLRLLKLEAFKKIRRDRGRRARRDRPIRGRDGIRNRQDRSRPIRPARHGRALRISSKPAFAWRCGCAAGTCAGWRPRSSNRVPEELPQRGAGRHTAPAAEHEIGDEREGLCGKRNEAALVIKEPGWTEECEPARHVAQTSNCSLSGPQGDARHTLPPRTGQKPDAPTNFNDSDPLTMCKFAGRCTKRVVTLVPRLGDAGTFLPRVSSSYRLRQAATRPMERIYTILLDRGGR